MDRKTKHSDQKKLEEQIEELFPYNRFLPRVVSNK
jgi:hypothetical protein